MKTEYGASLPLRVFFDVIDPMFSWDDDSGMEEAPLCMQEYRVTRPALISSGDVPDQSEPTDLLCVRRLGMYKGHRRYPPENGR